MRPKHYNQDGQSLLELLVAMVVFIFVISSIMFLVLDAHSANRQGGERTRAAFYIQGGYEAVRSIANRGWRYLQDGVYGLTSASGQWELQASPDVIDGQYTRTVTVAPVYRDAAGTIVDSGGTLDIDTKRVTASVTWDFTASRPETVSAETYITNWQSRKWLQTTQAEFDGGATTDVVSTNVSGGELELSPAGGGLYGNQFLVQAAVNAGAMNRINRRTSMRFTAQNSGSVTSLRAYVGAENGASPSYRYGLQADVAGNPSGTWLGSTNQGYGNLTVTSTGWKTIPLLEAATLAADSVYHLVVQPVGTPTNQNNISMRVTDPPNRLVAFNNRTDLNADVLWYDGSQWSAQGHQPLYALEYDTGTGEGNPYADTAEALIYESNYIGEEFIAASDMDVSQIGLYVRKNANQNPAGNLAVALYNTSTSTMIGQGDLVTAGDVTRTYTWYAYSFPSTVHLAAGDRYRVYLSSNASIASRAYQVYWISHVADPLLQGINYRAADAVLTTSANSGSSWTADANADIGGFRFTVTSGYVAAGEFISSPYDSASATALPNYLVWAADVPSGAALQFQVRFGADLAALLAAPWTGPDGTAATYYDTAGQVIDEGAGAFRWMQYRAVFMCDGVTTPVLYDVTIDYGS